MPSRAQYGGSINDKLDQHCAQRPLPSPNGSRQDAQSWGKAKSSMSRRADRSPLRKRAFDGAPAGLAETSSFMLQR
jgi:hypothetical protein